MKKYIVTALVLCAFVASPVRAESVLEQRQAIMRQLIVVLTQLVHQLQEQLRVELAKQAPVTITAGVSEVSETEFTVTAQGKASDNHYFFGGNCDQTVFESNKPAMMYNPENKSWTGDSQRFIFRPQATSTKLNLVFTSGSQRVDYVMEVGEAVDRSASTGQQFDYQLGMCK